MTDATTPHAEAAPAFNLLDEPWLPVRWLNGGSTEVGLREVFARSHEIAGLAEPSPASFVALHRLLLAVTHRALTLQFGRWTDSDRARWYSEGLPLAAFERYFDHWRERFWLFHPKQPFMQVAALATLAQTQPAKPWTAVSLESAGGNNPVIFDHSVDDLPGVVSAAHVLRRSLGFLQFAAGGPVKVLRKDGFGRKGALFDSAAILPTGESLQRTILLALHPAPRAADEADNDQPSWEKPPIAPDDLTPVLTLPTGPNDRYTRCIRALLLQGASNNTVTRVHFCEGLDLLEDENAADPMNAFRQGTDKWVRLRFTEERSAWRDLPALLPSASGGAWRPAAVLSWAQNLFDAAGAWDDELEVTVAGMAANQGKMLQSRLERFRLPQGLLTAAENAAALRTHLQHAEELFSALRHLAARCGAQALPNASSKETQKQARAAVDAGPLAATFFARAERGLPALLAWLGAGGTEAAHAAWQAALLDAARLAWAAAGDMLGPSAAALRARALTEGAFNALIKPLRPPAPDAPSPDPLHLTEEVSP
jgi:CRISPR system Cascade subunit CasA